MLHEIVDVVRQSWDVGAVIRFDIAQVTCVFRNDQVDCNALSAKPTTSPDSGKRLKAESEQLLM